MPMTIEPKPYALRIVTSNFGAVACVCAAYIRAPLRRMPARSEAEPGMTPGLSDKKTSGRWNESATVMKCAALSAASAVIEPALTARLVRDDRDRVPAEIAECANDRAAEVGLHLERRTGVEHDVDHLAHVVDAPAVVRDDVEHLGNETRCGVAVVAPSDAVAGGYDHADDGK